MKAKPTTKRGKVRKNSRTIVGHKTFHTPGGGFRHEPLTQGEADALMAAADAAQRRRAETMPDERTAIHAMFDAWLRLKELGWSEAIYCPKDGSTFLAIEPGSTGIHECTYEGKWPNGSWWVHYDGDSGPSHPVLWKPQPDTAEIRPTQRRRGTSAMTDAERQQFLTQVARDFPQYNQYRVGVERLCAQLDQAIAERDAARREVEAYQTTLNDMAGSTIVDRRIPGLGRAVALIRARVAAALEAKGGQA